MAAAMYGAAAGLLFGWLFAVGTAMVFAFACYALVRMARPQMRTRAAWSCVITTHLVYLVAIGVLMNTLR